MRTYLILKEKGAQWNADPEIKSLLAEISETTEDVTQIHATAFERIVVGQF